MIKDGINMYSNYVISPTMARKLCRKFIQQKYLNLPSLNDEISIIRNKRSGHQYCGKHLVPSSSVPPRGLLPQPGQPYHPSAMAKSSSFISALSDQRFFGPETRDLRSCFPWVSTSEYKSRHQNCLLLKAT